MLLDLPRFEACTLKIEIEPHADTPPHIKDRLARMTLKVFTGDPLEAERDTDWMFAANRTAPERELVIYISAGHAELEADQVGWDEILRQAAARGLAVWDTHPDLVEHGHLTLEPVAADLPEPIDVNIAGFSADRWRRGDLGLVVDIAEIETGEVAFDPVMVSPADVPEPEPGCPGCAGEPIRLVHIPEGYIDRLCSGHNNQFNDEQADAGDGEAFSAAGRLMLAMVPELSEAIATGFWERARRSDESSDPHVKASFLDWIVSSFEGHGDRFTMVMEFDGEADAIFRAVHDVAEVDPDRAIELGSGLTDLYEKSERWLMEMTYIDALRNTGRTEEAEAILAGWLVQARADPYLYTPTGDQYLQWGNHQAAHDAHTKAYGTSVMNGSDIDAVYALHRLKDAAREMGRHERVAEAVALIALIEASGTASLRRGRNEPCICGSGLKTKRCCGGVRRH